MTEWIKGIFQELIRFFVELPIKILDGILSAIAAIFEALPAPAFLSNAQLNSWLPDDIKYFLVMSSIPEALAIIGSAVTFFILRKILTLGRW